MRWKRINPQGSAWRKKRDSSAESVGPAGARMYAPAATLLVHDGDAVDPVGDDHRAEPAGIGEVLEAHDAEAEFGP